jgi:hypothetical protein
MLSTNSNAGELLKENPDKIDWRTVWKNPSIFKLCRLNDSL